MIQIAEKIIDPCCGTGSFLEAVIRNTPAGACRVPGLVGFEILPAPYALAHYRLNRAIHGTPFEHSVQILLTDTLAVVDWEGVKVVEIVKLFVAEGVEDPDTLGLGEPEIVMHVVEV